MFPCFVSSLPFVVITLSISPSISILITNSLPHPQNSLSKHTLAKRIRKSKKLQNFWNPKRKKYIFLYKKKINVPFAWFTDPIPLPILAPTSLCNFPLLFRQLCKNKKQKKNANASVVRFYNKTKTNTNFTNTLSCVSFYLSLLFTLNNLLLCYTRLSMVHAILWSLWSTRLCYCVFHHLKPKPPQKNKTKQTYSWDSHPLPWSVTRLRNSWRRRRKSHCRSASNLWPLKVSTKANCARKPKNCGNSSSNWKLRSMTWKKGRNVRITMWVATYAITVWVQQKSN